MNAEMNALKLAIMNLDVLDLENFTPISDESDLDAMGADELAQHKALVILHNIMFTKNLGVGYTSGRFIAKRVDGSLVEMEHEPNYIFQPLESVDDELVEVDDDRQGDLDAIELAENAELDTKVLNAIKKGRDTLKKVMNYTRSNDDETIMKSIVRLLDSGEITQIDSGRVPKYIES